MVTPDPSPAEDSVGADRPPEPQPNGPSESMEIEDLRQMADAYEVAYTPRTSKKTLVKRIKEAME